MTDNTDKADTIRHLYGGPQARVRPRAQPDDAAYKARFDAAHDLAGHAYEMFERHAECGHAGIDLMPVVWDFDHGPVELELVLGDGDGYFGLQLTRKQFEYLAHVFDLIRKERREPKVS